eukprot:scaffold8234_cov248-Pinguiococcus_pyrenoidosus.AAC.8
MGPLRHSAALGSTPAALAYLAAGPALPVPFFFAPVSEASTLSRSVSSTSGRLTPARPSKTDCGASRKPKRLGTGSTMSWPMSWAQSRPHEALPVATMTAAAVIRCTSPPFLTTTRKFPSSCCCCTPITLVPQLSCTPASFAAFSRAATTSWQPQSTVTLAGVDAYVSISPRRHWTLGRLCRRLPLSAALRPP